MTDITLIPNEDGSFTLRAAADEKPNGKGKGKPKPAPKVTEETPAGKTVPEATQPTEEATQPTEEGEDVKPRTNWDAIHPVDLPNTPDTAEILDAFLQVVEKGGTQQDVVAVFYPEGVSKLVPQTDKNGKKISDEARGVFERRIAQNITAKIQKGGTLSKNAEKDSKDKNLSEAEREMAAAIHALFMKGLRNSRGGGRTDNKSALRTVYGQSDRIKALMAKMPSSKAEATATAGTETKS